MTKTYDDIMNIRLIGYTQPVDMIGIDDVQDLIAYCAKVSNPQFQTDFSRSDKLLNYLIQHKHWSPFEMASATMEATTTRDIARQFLRHRSFSFQEFSQRYANPQDMPNSFVLREARLQDEKNRQNSISTDDEELQNQWNQAQQDVIDLAKVASVTPLGMVATLEFSAPAETTATEGTFPEESSFEMKISPSPFEVKFDIPAPGLKSIVLLKVPAM
jgi:hypothetical protein